ncbi:hypothetical protein BD309DRAFT_994565 [Dichomitus squalens]|nr:hypothetical protein BD309DRAFT_994565 [Dichomitus squalens]
MSITLSFHGHDSRATGEEGEVLYRNGDVSRFAAHYPQSRTHSRLNVPTLSLWRHRRVVHFLAADRAILALIVASSRMLSRTMVAAYSASAKMRSILSQAGVCTRTPSRARTIMLDVVRARGVHPMLGGSFANLAGGVQHSRKTPRFPTHIPPTTMSHRTLSPYFATPVCMIWEKRAPNWLPSMAAEDNAHTYATDASTSNELVK